MKTQERMEARRLRREQGLPIKVIARRLGVAVSSVSVWVRDVELTAAQHEALRALNPAYNHQRNGWKTNSTRFRARRVAYQEGGRQLARRYEPLHIAGCMLYWAEGSRARNQIRFTNSDPEMVRFFVHFLRAYFELEESDIRLTCNLFADHLERQKRSSVSGSKPPAFRAAACVGRPSTPTRSTAKRSGRTSSRTGRAA
jgi:transcriptional regulator with XRE-family HTH domain